MSDLPAPLDPSLQVVVNPYGHTFTPAMPWPYDPKARGATVSNVYRMMWHGHGNGYADIGAQLSRQYRDTLTHWLVSDLVIYLRALARDDNETTAGPNDYLAVILDAINELIHEEQGAPLPFQDDATKHAAAATEARRRLAND